MRNPEQKLVGWRFAAAFGVGIGVLIATIYPIIIYPMNNPESFRKYEKAREKWLKEKGLTREDIQPGGMKVWTDPFDRPSKTDK